MRVKLSSFLHEICDKTTINNQYPVLTSSKNGLYLQNDYFNKQVASKENTGYKIIKKGQFTYRAMSDTGEFFPNMLDCAEIGIVSPAYPVFEISDTTMIIPDFLKYYFKSDKFQFSISGFAQGSTRTSVKFSKLKETTIDLYGIDKQKEIVSTLDKVQSIITKRKEQLAKLDELIKARFVEMFGDPTNVNLQRVPLGEFVDNTRYGTSQPPQFSDYGSFKFIRATNIKNGHIIEKDMLRISADEADKISKCKLNGGELVIVRSGANTGDTCVITEDYKGQYAGYDIIVSLKTDKLNPIFLNELINIPEYMKTVVKPLTARSAQPHLNTQQVQNLPIMIVDIRKQNQFATFVKHIDKSKVVIQKALDEAQLLFDSLMQEYFG